MLRTTRRLRRRDRPVARNPPPPNDNGGIPPPLIVAVIAVLTARYRRRRFVMFRVLPAIIMTLLLWSLLPAGAARRQSVETVLQTAERQDARKNFAAAADAYERALKTGQVPTQRRDRVEYRLAIE